MSKGEELTIVIKKLWKNEYFQTLLTVALLLLIVFGGYYGAQVILGTPYPALAVASGSMLPTLNIGDLIIVQGVDPAQIKADPYGLTGDILVYRRGSELIVHRAIGVENRGGVYYIITRGDNSGVNDPPWPSRDLVGKVVMRIPYIGNLPLFLHSERNIYLLFLAIIVILIISMLPLGAIRGKTPESVMDKGKASNACLSYILYVAINLVIISLIVFSLWGSYTFPQPGASPRIATIMGMFTDRQYHESFPNVYGANLWQGLLTYRIDCKVSAGTRFGVPTFAWYQFFIIVLILFNAWKAIGFYKKWKL